MFFIASCIIVFMVIGMTLLETRKQYGVSQAEAASLLGVPVRTYIRYEKDDGYGSELKRRMMIVGLNDKYEITESKGILSVTQIKNQLADLFDAKYKGAVAFCYLFGSYAKGYAKEKSDVDLCVSTSLEGLGFVGLIEDVSQALRKKVDLIRLDGLKDNLELTSEIMKDGIKIYG